MLSDRPVRYLVSQPYALRGWKRLHYAVQNLRTSDTNFMTKDAFELLSSCNGIYPLGPDTLEEWEQRNIEMWLETGFIREAGPGGDACSRAGVPHLPARIEQTVHWSITGKCNYRCKHCFMSAPHAVQGEPSFEDCVRMLDSFQRCGIRAIHLTGGEPLVRRDFWQLMDEIYAHDMFVAVIYSNGLLAAGVEEAFAEAALRFGEHGGSFEHRLHCAYGAHALIGFAIRWISDTERPLSESLERFRELNTSAVEVSTRYLMGDR
jgi:hypothetical protein